MKGKAEKDRRRTEAIERNAKWSRLSTKQKIEELDKRGVRAEKQRAKLEKLLPV